MRLRECCVTVRCRNTRLLTVAVGGSSKAWSLPLADADGTHDEEAVEISLRVSHMCTQLEAKHPVSI